MENKGKSKDTGPEKPQFTERDGNSELYEIGGGSGTKNLISQDEEEPPHYIQSLADEYYAEEETPQLGDEAYAKEVASPPADLETCWEPAVFGGQPAARPEAQVRTNIRQVVRGPGINYMDGVYCPSINPMTTIQINVRQELVPHIIGKGGSHEKHIWKVAHVSLDISREPSRMKMITIAGGYREASTAARMVVELIDIIVYTLFKGNKTHGLWASMIEGWKCRWPSYY